MQYLFVLGKNWLLSVAELIACMDNNDVPGRVVDFSRNVCIYETEKRLDVDRLVEIQSSLGGCYKTATVIDTYDAKTVIRAFPKSGRADLEARREVLSCRWLGSVWKDARRKTVRFAVSTYPVSKRSRVDLRKLTLGIDETVKDMLTERGAKKVSYYVYEGPDRRDPERPNTALWPHTLARHGLLRPPNAEIILAFTESSVYVGKTAAVYDSIFQRHRDENRPYVVAEITTSPKLCRALLNLAGVRSGQVILDPFCGTGTVLMEAALLDIECVGLDIDPRAIDGTKSNMRWLGSIIGDRLRFSVVRGDARRAHQILERVFDAIVSEPPLGPVYKDIPTWDEAQKSMIALTQLYQESLRSLSNILKPKGKLAMTLPVVSTELGPVSIDLAEMTRDTGFRVCDPFPRDRVVDNRGVISKKLREDRPALPERKRGQIVQREVITLCKT
ncbi:MAG: methyltransferase domain-containing protein [Candidatus Thorarchaeota archaeon]